MLMYSVTRMTNMGNEMTTTMYSNQL